MLNNIKNKIGKSARSKKLNVFGLFLLVSFLILVITKLSDTYVEIVPVSLHYKNLPDKNIITLDTIPKLNVTVSTNGFKLLSYFFKDRQYSIDLEKNAYVKDNNYIWLPNVERYDLKSILGSSVSIVSVKPDTIRLPFGVLNLKKVPVVLQSNVTFFDGYDTLEGFEISPDSINVIGSQKDIDSISFVNTKPLNLELVKDDIKTNLELDFLNLSDRLKLSDSNVVVTSKVEKFTEGTFDVAVNILNLPKDVEINYFPKKIKVSYYISLDDYKDVKASDFIIECNYKDVFKSKKSFFKPKLFINSNKVKWARMKQSKVEYIIK